MNLNDLVPAHKPSIRGKRAGIDAVVDAGRGQGIVIAGDKDALDLRKAGEDSEETEQSTRLTKLAVVDLIA